MTHTPEQIMSVISVMLQPQLVDPNAPACWLWPREDRAVISINPHNVKSIDAVLSDRFRHALETRLGGVRVVKTNTRGIFYQVGYEPRPVARLDSRPLDLSLQPTPLAVPIGVTASLSAGLWINITEMVSVLVGGARRLGKTRLLHAWIQALVYGGSAELVLYDGKDGVEFSRYAAEAGVTYTADLAAELARLNRLVVDRQRLLLAAHAPDLPSYNARVAPDQRLPVVVLIIDEVALIDAQVADTLAHLIAVSGAHGIIPVLCTQRTGREEVSPLTKTNLVTRIALPVPTQADSQVILGRAGAEKLPKTAGRLLFAWHGRMIAAQAFAVDLPGAPALTEREADLARWAIANHNGRLSIPLLVREQSMPEREARELLDVWQSRGWLTGAGQGVARRVSPDFEAILSKCQSCQSVKVGAQQPDHAPFPPTTPLRPPHDIPTSPIFTKGTQQGTKP